MKKIDENLLKYLVLSEEKCTIEGLVYYTNRLNLLNFLKNKKIDIISELPFLSAFVVCFKSKQLYELSKQSFVSYISSLATAKTFIDISKKIIGINKNNEYNGENQTVVIIDTGINPHIDFLLANNRIIYFKDFINNKNIFYDDNGHGTFVSGILAGSGTLSNGKYKGVAPRANIVSLKALNNLGEANATTILQAMQWVFDNKQKYKINTVCMSFGSEPLGSYDPIMKGAEKLWQEGITVVCAAGNSGPDYQTIKSPGISRKIITVGGLDDCRNEYGEYSIKNFKVADFSSRGPVNNRVKPDLIAPSVNITSCGYKGNYISMSGTSVATPMVAGLAVIIKQKFSNATPDMIKGFLISNAISIGENKFSQGYGIANIKSIYN